MKKKIVIVASLILALVIAANNSLASPPKKAKIVKKHEVKAIVTAYYLPSPKQKKFATGSYKGDRRMNGTGKTFSGKKVALGFAAADHKYFPPGTKIYVPGHGKVTVEDVGGGVKGRHIDIFVGEGDQGLEKALNWGKQKKEVIVLAWGK